MGHSPSPLLFILAEIIDTRVFLRQVHTCTIPVFSLQQLCHTICTSNDIAQALILLLAQHAVQFCITRLVRFSRQQKVAEFESLVKFFQLHSRSIQIYSEQFSSSNSPLLSHQLALAFSVTEPLVTEIYIKPSKMHIYKTLQNIPKNIFSTSSFFSSSSSKETGYYTSTSRL